MRRATLLTALSLAVVACGHAAQPEPQSPAVHEPGPTVVLADAPEWEPAVDDRPLYQGFGSLTQQPEALVALAQGDISIYSTPTDNDISLTVPWRTILGTVTVLSIIDRPSAGWVEVMLPIRPNGSTGFVRTSDVEIYAVGGKILVDLSDRELTYTMDGEEILSTTVAVGAAANPTPTGLFFVTDNVTLANPNSPWGPHALGLSARSDTITEYNGGDGIIGIHGTNNPGSIGHAASLGCVRLPNEVITMLHRMVPIGTPVEIRA